MRFLTYHVEAWANGPDEEMLAMLAGVYLIILGVGMLFGIVKYVLESLSLYTIAKRRGINRPWLAWIPVASSWILGSISDQYQYVVNRKVQNRRKVLLGLAIAMVVVPLLVIWAAASFVAVVVTAAQSGGHQPEAGAMLGSMGGMLLSAWGVFALGVVYAVFHFISLYHLYKSCDPSTCTVFLVLSILFGVTMPFFLLVDRNKDLGMPPRRAQPRPAAPEGPPEELTQLPEPAPEISEEPEVPQDPPESV